MDTRDRATKRATLSPTTSTLELTAQRSLVVRVLRIEASVWTHIIERFHAGSRAAADDTARLQLLRELVRGRFPDPAALDGEPSDGVCPACACPGMQARFHRSFSDSAT